MFIYYYTIPRCVFSVHEGKNVILPPEGTAEGLLRQYGFQQTESGSWYKIPTQQEYAAIMKGYPNYHVIFSFDALPAYEQDFQNSAPPPPVRNAPAPSYPKIPENPEKQNDKNKNILGCIALGLVILPFVIICISTESFSILLAFGSVITSLIITIILRIRYPESIFGKILLGIHILLFILLIIAIIEIIRECIQCIDSCNNCSR